MSSASSSDVALAMEMRGIVKRFPGVVANDGINLALRAGEIHALLGENGAGKSTLMSILGGLYRPDEGHLLIRGQMVNLRSPRDAIAHGIGMVHQHFMLVRQSTVAENVILGLRTPRFLIDTKRIERDVAALSRRFALDLDPGALIWQLSVGEQQRVELLKILYRRARVLILDEPTAVLTPQETIKFYSTLRALVLEGYSVIYISHKLDEVRQISDRITVLRRGRVVAAGLPAANTSREQLAEIMVGRPVPRDLRKVATIQGECVLEAQSLWASNDRGLPALRQLTLRIHAGEVYGLAGVAGNGQRELAELLTGLRPVMRGRFFINGEEVTGTSAADLISLGVGYVPEDRNILGCAPHLTVAENLLLKSQRARELGSRWFLDKAKVRREAEERGALCGIPASLMDRQACTLSGGNLQKVILARELSVNPRLLVAAYPTRGLDVAATEQVHHLLLQARKQGCAILLISEDLEELLSLSDRVGIICRGQIVGENLASAFDVQNIGLLMGADPGGADDARPE